MQLKFIYGFDSYREKAKMFFFLGLSFKTILKLFFALLSSVSLSQFCQKWSQEPPLFIYLFIA